MSKVGGTRYQVQFFRLQKLNRKIAYCCIRSTYVDVRSCFRHLLLLLLFNCCCSCWCSFCCCYLLLLRLPLLLLVLLLMVMMMLLHYVLLVGPARCFYIFFQLSCESYMVMVVVPNPQKSSGYDQDTTMRKIMWVVTPRCAAAAVVSAVVLRRPTIEYTHRYSMMRRRLPTAGVEVAPHFHQYLLKYIGIARSSK